MIDINFTLILSYKQMLILVSEFLTLANAKMSF